MEPHLTTRKIRKLVSFRLKTQTLQKQGPPRIINKKTQQTSQKQRWKTKAKDEALQTAVVFESKQECRKLGCRKPEEKGGTFGLALRCGTVTNIQVHYSQLLSSGAQHSQLRGTNLDGVETLKSLLYRRHLSFQLFRRYPLSSILFLLFAWCCYRRPLVAVGC